MGSIARLLFGRAGGVLAELLDPADQASSGLAEQARRAGQWCASTPGSVKTPLSRLTADVLGMS